MFYKKTAPKNFVIFTGKHVLESLLNNVAGLQPCNFIKKKTPTQLFSSEYCEILKNPYFEEHLRMAPSVIRHKFYMAENIAQKEMTVIKDALLER